MGADRTYIPYLYTVQAKTAPTSTSRVKSDHSSSTAVMGVMACAARTCSALTSLSPTYCAQHIKATNH